MTDAAFDDELQTRIWTAAFQAEVARRRANGADARATIVGALTATIGKPPARGERERRFVRLLIESGAPRAFFEDFLAR